MRNLELRMLKFSNWQVLRGGMEVRTQEEVTMQHIIPMMPYLFGRCSFDQCLPSTVTIYSFAELEKKLFFWEVFSGEWSSSLQNFEVWLHCVKSDKNLLEEISFNFFPKFNIIQEILLLLKRSSHDFLFKLLACYSVLSRQLLIFQFQCT